MQLKNKGLNFADILTREIQRQEDSPVYCMFCGDDVKQPRIDDPKDWKGHLQWSIDHEVHVNCYRKNLMRRGR